MYHESRDNMEILPEILPEISGETFRLGYRILLKVEIKGHLYTILSSVDSIM